MMVTIYSSPSLPCHWIAFDGSTRPWLVPNVAGGWAQRKPAKQAVALRSVAQETARLVKNLLGCGST